LNLRPLYRSPITLTTRPSLPPSGAVVNTKTSTFVDCQQCTSSSSRMRVIYHNWSATKQRPHPQSVAEIRRHSVLSGQDLTMWDININALLTWQMMICLFIASDESEPTSPPLYALILTPTRELAIQTRDHIQAVTKYTNITVRLMPMTHLPEIGAKNACQKTDTINWHEKRAYPIFTRNCCQKNSVPNCL